MNIYFFYPSKIIGGVEMLFIRIAGKLAEDNNSVYIIDYPGGIYSKFNDGQFDIIYNSNSVEIKDNAIIVTPPTDLYQIDIQLKPKADTKFLFWFLSPFNLTYILPLFSNETQHSNKYLLKRINQIAFVDYYLSTKKFLELADKRRGLAFMDKNVLRFNSYMFDCKFVNESYLKIPVELKRILCTQRKTKGSALNLAWIGRLKKDVVEILKYLFSDLNRVAVEKGILINLDIIGDGSEEKKLRELSDEYDNIQINFKGTFLNKEFTDYLTNSVDCVFAFGTSALEGAKLGIPTCLLDATYKMMLQGSYKYKWLFQSLDFKTGLLLEHYDNLPEENTLMIEDVLVALLSNYSYIANACYSYVYNNHNLDNTYDEFKKAVQKSELCYGHFKKFLKQPFVHSLYRRFK